MRPALRITTSPYRIVAAGYVVASILLWPLPVFNVLHVESSAVIATVGFFLSGPATITLVKRGVRGVALLPGLLFLLAVPWVLLTMSLAWAPNCAYWAGLGFYFLFPFITVYFATGLGNVVALLFKRRPRLVFILIGLGIVLGGTVCDLGFHPQFFTYNHVFGGFLGPIYDRELAIRGGMFWFRGLTLCWGSLFFLTARSIELKRTIAVTGRQSGNELLMVRILLMVLTLTTAVIYVFSSDLGIRTTYRSITQRLPGRIRTSHFDIYYDPRAVQKEDLKYLANEHEFQYSRIQRILDVNVRSRIQSFIYPDPDVKASVTGARYTNVAPVWLLKPQVHVLQSNFDAVFSHELVHVFSREFGLPGLHLSLSPGLIEGLAVAFEANDGLPPVHQQILTAAGQQNDLGLHSLERMGSDLASRLDPVGFWTGRGAVSYAVTGSFLKYLNDAYGAARLKEVYALGNFVSVFGKPVDVLAGEWQSFLMEQPYVARPTYQLVSSQFAVPSLFEEPCPHFVPGYLKQYRRADDALTHGDTTGAVRRLEEALRENPGFYDALTLWARLALLRGLPDSVTARLTQSPAMDRPAVIWMQLGDAASFREDRTSACTFYQSAFDRLPLYARESRARLINRFFFAGNSALIEVIYRGADDSGSLKTLLNECREGNPVCITYAQILAERNQYEEAARVLERSGIPAFPVQLDRKNIVSRFVPFWMATYYYRGGYFERSRRFISVASAGFRKAGDWDMIRLLEDLEQKSIWADRHSNNLFISP